MSIAIERRVSYRDCDILMHEKVVDREVKEDRGVEGIELEHDLIWEGLLHPIPLGNSPGLRLQDHLHLGGRVDDLKVMEDPGGLGPLPHDVTYKVSDL